MAHLSHVVAKFVAFWIAFVVAKIIVIAQSTTAEISIIKAILGESITVGVILIFAYYLMKEFRSSLAYNQSRDERMEKIIERDIEFRERQINAFREQTEAFKKLHETITDMKKALDEKS